MKLIVTPCLLALICLANTPWASGQEEPIAVAQPAETLASPAASSPALSADASRGAGGEAAKAKAEAAPTKVRPLTISVQLLRSDLVITGSLTDSTMLALKTAFGEASIPLSEVAGVRLPSGQDTSTTLVMLNGDSITGASDIKTITIETEWGIAKVNGENISSMMFVPGLEWHSINGLNGARWTLTEAKAQPSRPNATGNFMPGSAAPGGSSSNSVQSSSNPAPGLPAPANGSVPRVVFPR